MIQTPILGGWKASQKGVLLALVVLWWRLLVVVVVVWGESESELELCFGSCLGQRQIDQGYLDPLCHF